MNTKCSVINKRNAEFWNACIYCKLLITIVKSRIFNQDKCCISGYMTSHNMMDGSIIEHNMSQHQLEDFEHRSSTLAQLELHVYLRGIWSSVAEVVQLHYYFFQKLPPSCSTSALQGKQRDIQSQVIPNLDLQSHLNLQLGPQSQLKSQRRDQFLHANKLNVCCSDD